MVVLLLRGSWPGSWYSALVPTFQRSLGNTRGSVCRAGMHRAAASTHPIGEAAVPGLPKESPSFSSQHPPRH